MQRETEQWLQGAEGADPGFEPHLKRIATAECNWGFASGLGQASSRSPDELLQRQEACIPSSPVAKIRKTTSETKRQKEDLTDWGAIFADARRSEADAQSANLRR